MYQLGRRIHHHRRIQYAFLFLVVLGSGSLVTYWLLHTTTKPNAVIHNAPPLSTSYAPASTALTHIDKPLFTIDLPAGWQEVTSIAKVNTPTDSFKSPSVLGRELDVFIDTVPTSMAVNRVVAVTAKGASLDHGNVSDNCASFTRPSKIDPGSGVAQGIWQGAGFLCDLGNYERDVVGTASPDGINSVNVTGARTGTHKVFMAYTDNGINPDFSVLYGILESFQLK